MKNSLFFFTTFLSILWLFSSCHALVDDEFPEFAKMPVLNALLQADSTFRVQVSLTANLTDTALTYVPNARVIIESSVAAPDTLIYTDEGWYISARTVKAGASYSCKAEIPGYSTISAQTTVPTRTPIDSVAYFDLVGRDEEGGKISSVQFRIQNNVAIKSFWSFNLKVKGIGTDYNWETKEWTEGVIVQEKYFYMKAEQDSVLLNEANPLEVFSNTKMKNDRYWVRTYLKEHYGPEIGEKDTVVIELLNVDESYYRYAKQYYIYESASYPNIGQAQQFYPLYSNVKNGLGVFTGVSVTRKELAPLTSKGE
jgi:hypothetical protein